MFLGSAHLSAARFALANSHEIGFRRDIELLSVRDSEPNDALLGWNDSLTIDHATLSPRSTAGMGGGGGEGGFRRRSNDGTRRPTIHT